MGTERFGGRSSSGLAGTSRRPRHAPALLLASLILQRRRQRTLAPPPFRDRPRQRAPLGSRSPARSRHPLQEAQETLLAHFDFLYRVFLAHGLPLAFCVDYHSFFFTRTPDSFTQLGEALHFYGIALRYAPTPQAKGKIERRHDYWQKRLPPLLAADQILTLESANALLDQVLAHANAHEIHRELGSTPDAARA